MVVFDSSVLLITLDPQAKAPSDPATGDPVDRAADRIEYLIQRLSKARETIVIPTPVLSEVLVRAGSATQDYIALLNTQSCFRIAPFDQKAAIEAAIAMRDALGRGGLRIDAANPEVTKAKVKFDRQIVAIAKTEGAHTIYADDDDIIKYADQAKLNSFRTADLDLPPESPQQVLDFEEKDAE